MIKYLLLISFFSFSQEIITLEKAIQYAIDNSNNIKIAKNDLIINDNNTSLGSAGLLPSIIITSGYNSSVSNSELKLNSFLDFGGESMNEIDANNLQLELIIHYLMVFLGFILLKNLNI